MKHLICAIYEQAIKDYYKYMLGGAKVTNEYDLKCILELFDSDILDTNYIYNIIDTLNNCIKVMDINNTVPDDCPIWLVKTWCKYRHKKYKRIGKEIIIYE